MERANTLGFQLEEGRRISTLPLFAKLQHFGAATGLLDFSWSPLVALWIACREHPACDGAVLVANTGDTLRFVSAAGQEDTMDLQTVFSRTDPTVPELLCWEPVLSGPAMMRILRQRSVFIIGRPFVRDEDLEKIVIESKDKQEILDALDRLDVSQRTLFQDLYGFSSMESVNSPLPVSTSPQAHLRSANSYFRRGEYLLAISAYDQCIAQRPEVAEPYFLRGNAKAALGSFKHALQDYDLATQRKDTPILAFSESQTVHTTDNWFLFSIFFNRGNAKFMLDDFEGAMAYYNEATKLAPEFSEAYYNRGNAEAELGNWSQAISDFSTAWRIGSRGAARFNTGNTLARDGQFVEALDVFKDLTTDSNLGALAIENVENLEKIVSLLGNPSHEIESGGPERAREITVRIYGYQGKELSFIFRGNVGNSGNMGGDKQFGGKGYPGRPGFVVRIKGQ